MVTKAEMKNEPTFHRSRQVDVSKVKARLPEAYCLVPSHYGDDLGGYWINRILVCLFHRHTKLIDSTQSEINELNGKSKQPKDTINQ